MASPSLKIKLRLSRVNPESPGSNSIQSPDVPSPSLSAIAGQKHPKEDEEVPASKRPRPRAKKPVRKNDSNDILDDDSALGDDIKGDKQLISRSGASRKDILKFKDFKPRRWVNSNLVFRTLDGSSITLSGWQTEEQMTMNDKLTEPTTVAEIDQLFSSNGGEKDFRPFLCTQPGCSKSFTTYDQLQTHETNMHGTKKLICGIDNCHKSFVTTGQLTKHRKMVHFRAARKAKLAAAAAAEADNAREEGSDGGSHAPNTPNDTILHVNEEDEKTQDEDSVDIGISEDNA
ncbi:C2H2-type zinc finger transcription factor [Phycomyces blakesleeanus]|uniref:C2H2-type zinc finger transcription factor n=1 Tax=Phycomyces blakesleeanus TaxID=4837 RepID=A0ABR3AXP9_PHYBL